MDNSTEGVTLLALFINDVLTEVEKLKADRNAYQFILQGYNISNPYDYVPITVYNELCTWVEANLGEKAIIQVGKNIGESVYKALIENGVINVASKPIEIIDGLVIAASSMIKDDKERGWEVINTSTNSIQMRRTQTFNSKLQFGLLEGLISKCPFVKSVNLSYVTEIQKGDMFDEYLITWQNK